MRRKLNARKYINLVIQRANERERETEVAAKESGEMLCFFPDSFHQICVLAWNCVFPCIFQIVLGEINFGFEQPSSVLQHHGIVEFSCIQTKNQTANKPKAGFGFSLSCHFFLLQIESKRIRKFNNSCNLKLFNIFRWIVFPWRMQSSENSENEWLS